MRMPGGDQMKMVHGRQPDTRIPGGDQMMMVHGQVAAHEDTWRRSDDDGRAYTGRQPDMRIPGGDQMMMVHRQDYYQDLYYSYNN